jgi:hypothetical protein
LSVKRKFTVNKRICSTTSWTLSLTIELIIVDTIFAKDRFTPFALLGYRLYYSVTQFTNEVVV